MRPTSALGTWLGAWALGLSLTAGLLSAAAAAEGPQAPLEVLLAVEREGAGNEQAQAAWRQLKQLDAAQLPELLAALDQASPLAANWIRSAIETITDRTLASGKPLPTAALEQFVADQRHDSRARRLAFECLAKAEPGIGDRLIPGMLGDRSNEFRRDAVARLMAQAKALLEAEKNDQARAVFQRALDGARDLDQVEELSEKLKTLGAEVDLPRHFGLLVDWKLIGPFDNTNTSGFDVAYPPEKEIDLSAKYEGKGQEVAWIDFTSKDRMGDVDLNTALGKHKGAAAYALAVFDAAAAGPVEIRLACVTANKVWVNGQLWGEANFYHAGEYFDQYVYRGRLKAGPNTILVKVLQNEQTESWAQVWNFKLRVCDESGTAVLARDRAAATTAGR